MAWVKGNRYLSLEEMQNNALIIYNYFTEKGWSINAICGMLGNMQAESTINPGIWQSLIEGSGGGGGWGLVQWTPWTNFTNWADSKGYSHDDGYAQCEWIETQTKATGQWIQTASYPITWDNFKVSVGTPEWLAYAFLFNFERPASLDKPERQTQARYWYDYITNGEHPITPTPSTRRKMPLWFMLRRRY